MKSIKPPNKPKIGILSLGCPRNLVDSESILARIKSKRYSIVDLDKADIAILNTCAFIEDAKRESIDAILDLIELKRKGSLKKIIILGCLPQRYKDILLREFPEVDAFIGRVSLNHSLQRFPLTPKYYAYLKICEGCLNNCSYCVIPKIKGKFTSLPMDSILGKINGFNRSRISELNIIGQDITGYGIDLYGTLKLSELLRKITNLAKNIRWIRLLYLYPTRITDELLKVIADTPTICKYIDLPLQHINNRILRLMQRQTSKDEILRLLEKIRKIIPQVAIRTSLIVGFPSETEEEFEELLNFIQEAKFERLGAFIYSREEGTPAYSFTPQIPQKIKIERFNTLMSKQQKISEELNKKFFGKFIEVLIEEKKNDFYLGRSQYDAPEVDGLVYVNSKRPLSCGEIIKAKIIDTLEYDLVAEAIE
ncbi:MAG: MiaB/RimO family radical SAM methylthiotransferase [Candidatus Omnitrophica bacterium]|nr:MiaB/RimO family radical SAM methylthiotransferase [Candidatus Omnitrophota bacterium]